MHKYAKRPVPGGTSLLLQQLLVQTELLVEAADASAGIHDLLLTGKEGVTLGANFHLDVLLGGASLDDIAAGAPDGGLIVVGMQSFLHGGFTSFSSGISA